MSCRSASVIATVCPSEDCARSHAARTLSGAPLTKSVSCPLRVHSTLIILRSRLNSSVASRVYCPSQ
eukprot:1188193-Prorocentrum_minimum.AAC.1